jgi:gluconolactonase
MKNTLRSNRVLVMLVLLALWPKPLPSEDVASRIVRLHTRFDELVDRDAAIEKIAHGFQWLEGPVWDRRRNALLFSDIPQNSVFRWTRAEGTSLFLRPSGYTGSAPFTGPEPGSNGLTFDAEGRLVLAQHGDRRVVRREHDGKFTVLAARYEGKRLNSPNDVVFDAKGNLYFTDPPFGLPGTFDDPGKELAFQGVYRLSRDGKLTLLTKELRAPNGIAFSPDEKTLYVTDVDPKRSAWLAFEVKSDGTLGKPRVLRDVTEERKKSPGGPDGIKVDKRGNLFGAAPGGVWVMAPDGALLGKIELGVKTGNVAFGEDGRTLFITASDAVYRVRLKTRGATSGR